ncbi:MULTISPECIES: hypothetical protein [Micrococcaceae]|nr:hypothetical protein [Arthrobacter sp. H16F315]MDD1475378.1 hypothetical protein [Arthrobacter sp. H16F315]
MTVMFAVVPVAAGSTFSTFSVYTALQIFGTYGLIALALGITMIAGQFDLSTLGMYSLGGMVAVKLGQGAPMTGVAAAVLVGAVAGLIQGSIVSRFRINSMAVTLGGFLVLLGLSRTLGDDRTVSYDDVGVGIILDRPLAAVLSMHTLVVLGCFVLIATVMARTRLGRDIRAVGGDARASHIAGVHVERVTTGVFVISGVLAGLAGALNAFTLSSALVNPGFAPLVFAGTAALIGGVGLAGGRGTAWGIALGALSLSLLQAMFGMLASPSWVSSIITGVLLAAAAAFSGLRRQTVWMAWKRSMSHMTNRNPGRLGGNGISP